MEVAVDITRIFNPKGLFIWKNQGFDEYRLVLKSLPNPYFEREISFTILKNSLLLTIIHKESSCIKSLDSIDETDNVHSSNMSISINNLVEADNIVMGIIRTYNTFPLFEHKVDGIDYQKISEDLEIKTWDDE